MFNIINFILVGGLAAFILIDTLFPARKFPKVSFWKVRGVLTMAMYFVLASYAPFLWAGWFGEYRLIDATALPLWIAAPLGYAVSQFFTYWWHRALHASDILWRVFHQMHHSIERMDAWGALYHSPLDIIGFTFMSSLALTIGIGLDPMAAAIAGVFGGFAVFFTHTNIKTPRWIGHIMARPENHGLHHQRGRHAGNYGELMLWDRLFGTWENPKEWNGQAGFYDGASDRVWEMLTFRDVTREPDRVDRETKLKRGQLVSR